MTRPLLLLVVLLAAGCGARAPQDAAVAPSAARSSNVITREEIADSGLTNMHEVIERLRPNFLRSRGPNSIMQQTEQVVVYLDDVYGGDVGMLRSIDANTVRRVEFVSGPDTGFRFGRNHSSGAIHIVTR